MNIIFSIFLFPLLSFLCLSFSQGQMSLKNIKIISVVSVLISFIITLFYLLEFYCDKSFILTQNLWTILSINKINIDVSLFLDELSLSMLGVVTGIGLLIHIYSVWYMKNQKGISRFFAYTNLFIASMLILVLADNFIFMYVGWEGVSVCSYLLIGFYYQNIKNSHCALKAFIITRISDIFLIVAFFLIYQKYQTFNFQDIKHFLQSLTNYDSNFYLINIFLLIGVIGKSAQLPLQTWLTSAMVGPTPVSALIHAATMVTAGVYLIARVYFLFLPTPEILYFMSIIGILTIFISSFSALVQSDLKRILAYSTMSQIGYMFLALGVQAWNAAIVHLITHAIFKALLFLSAGSIIKFCNDEKDIFKMGGLYKKIPFLYLNFLISSASLLSFPILTSGFYSKGNILFSVLNSGHINLFIISLFCSFLTVMYTCRMILLIFHGNDQKEIVSSYSTSCIHWTHYFPLLILSILSTYIGTFFIPSSYSMFPSSIVYTYNKFIFEIFSSIISLIGIFLSYYLWIKRPIFLYKIFKIRFIKNIIFIIFQGWGFDILYNIFFKKSYLLISRILCFDVFDKIHSVFILIIKKNNKFLLKYSNGSLKCYVISMIFGIILTFIFILFFYFTTI